MKRLGVMSIVAVSLVGCGLPQDAGVVMGCFGLVNQTVPGPEVVTNTYFGGCDPSDPGMQIIERATAAAAADQGIMTARCDIDCNARLVAYAAAHPEVTLPLSCQTLFAIPCEGLRSNVPQVGGSEAILQGGGPADMRFLLSGDVTLTVDGQSSVVPAAGIVDGTLATSCQGAPESCPVTLSRLDVVGLEPFNLGGIHVDSAHIQNQGLAVGSKSGGQIVIGAEAFEAEVSAVVGGALTAFHVRNDEPVQAGGDPTLEQFLSSLDITMTQDNVSVRIDMTGTPVGRRPVAAFTPQTTSYECPSSPCTVQLTSAASDPDDDLQGLSWLVDGVPQPGNASAAPETIDLVLPPGPHTVSLVATDSRGAASAASLEINVVDDVAPAVPTGLTVGIFDRRRVTMRLTWTAPDDSGARVAGYQIRYAKVPITTANFDDASVTTAVTYTGTPSAPTQVDGIDVSPLLMETDYYFAVAATDAGGNRSGIATTAGATRSPFSVTVVSGMAAADHIGQDLDGSGDFGRPAGGSFMGDGMSDLLVGTNGGGRAYMFMGNAAGYPSTPTVIFTGAFSGFGSAVANAGDIDGDMLDDIAITSTNDGTGKVYIYSRKPPQPWGPAATSWPSTLTDAQASYVISADASLTGISFRNLARLGNFDGVGSDDLLIAFRLRTAPAGNGSVFVVKGSSSFASVTIPNASAALEIDGVLPGISFGVVNVGLGPLLGQGFISSSSTAGTIYAFPGQTTAGPITAASNGDSVVGPAADRYGITLGFIGALGSSSPGALTIGSTVGQYVDVHLGTAATGPFLGTPGGSPAATVRFTDSASSNSFGLVNIGGGVKGTSVTASVIGDDTPDVILAGQAGPNLPIYVVDGTALSSLSGTVNLAAPSANIARRMVTILGRMPSPWVGYTTGTIIPDSDGDGYGDFAVGEFTTAAAGRVVIFH